MLNEVERWQKLADLHEEYAEAQAQSDYLDDMTKTMLSMYMAEAEAHGASSAAIQERNARKDDRFRLHLDAKKEAKRRALSIKGQITVMTMRFEWSRTKEATKRAEMQIR